MGEKDIGSIRSYLFTFFDEIKDLFTKRSFSRVLTDYSKNEILALFYLYRAGTSTVTEIADYINAPLNTATGVISRLEKKGVALRQRQSDDRRVVHISLTDAGKEEMDIALEQIWQLVEEVIAAFTEEEIPFLLKLVEKGIAALQSGGFREEAQTDRKKVRRISIE